MGNKAQEKQMPKGLHFCLKTLAVCLLYIFTTHNVYAQCPSIASAKLTTSDVTCFGSGNGVIKVVLPDSGLYPTKKFFFVLYQWVGATLTKKQTIGVTGSKYNATFTGLGTGAYDVMIARTSFTNNCASFPLYGSNVAPASYNPPGGFSGAFVRGAVNFNSIIINEPVAVSAGSYVPSCDSTSFQLAADEPAPVGYPASVGTWSEVSGPTTVAFSNVNDPYAIVSNLVPGDYVLRWKLTKAGCPDRFDDATISVRKSAIAGAGSDTTICGASSFVMSGSPLQSLQTGQWTQESGPTTVTFDDPTSSTTNVSGMALGVYEFIWTISTGGACSDASDTVRVTNNAVPAAPTSAGLSPNPVCEGQNVAFTLSPINATTTYTWTGPNGILSQHTGAQALPSITNVQSTQAGAYSVTATLNGCTSTPRSAGTLVVSPVASQPSTISGNVNVCQGDAGVAYSVTAVPGVTYSWSYSGTGATITGSSNSITIDYSTAATSGTLSVSAISGTCSSAVRTQAIVVNTKPAQPSVIAGNASVCQGTTGVAYSVTNVPGVTYVWSYSGTGATLTGTGNSRTIDYSATATSGNLTVTAVLGSCSSVVRTQAIVVNATPAQPGAITGKTPVCQGESGVAYSVTAVPGVTYAWSYSGTGVVITGTSNAVTANYSATATSGTISVRAVAGTCSSTVSTQAIVVNAIPAQPSVITGKTPVCQNETGIAYSVTSVPGVTYSWAYTGTGATINGTSNAVTIDYSSAATSGNLTVTAISNACSSTVRTQAIVVNPLPTQPSAITGKTSVCQSETGVAYSVTAVPGVTYAWTYSGTGATITGGTSNAITVSYGATATSGTLSVTAISASCSSTVRTHAIVVNTAPAQPTAIVGKTPVCQGESGLAYSVTNVPGVTYTWAYSGTGATITGSSNSVSIDYSATATAGNLTVTAASGTCSSAVRTQAIVVNPTPSQPSVITGKTPVCQGELGVSYSVTNVLGVTYAWSYSGTGATLSGTGNTRSIDYSSTATSGNLTVSAVLGTCTSTVRTQAIVINPVPVQPTAIIGKTPVCQNETGVAYSVTAVPGVTYSWTYSGTGATITGSSNSVSLDYSATATSGNLSVTAISGACSSVVRTQAIVVNTTPAQPSAITGKTPVCQGESGLTYSVTNVAGVTYSWAYTGTGATLTGTGNTRSVDYSATATSGNLTVTAIQGTCSSLVRTQAILVNPIPSQPTTVTGKSPVCQGETAVAYSVTNVPGVTYVWSYSGTGATITGTTSSISVDYSTAATSGNLTVMAVSGACSSAVRTQPIVVNPTPTQPSSIAGKTPVCQGETGITYSVTNVAGLSYVWAYTGTGTTVSGTGNTGTVDYSATATSGSLTVTAVAGTCSSTVRSQAIVVTPLPSQPSAISGKTSVCQGETGVAYSVTNVPGVTYTWAYSGTGANLTGTGNTRTIDYSATATSGNITVTAISGSCSSAVRIQAIIVNPIPAQPGTITGKTPVCQGETAVPYSVTAVAGVTYTWSYTGTGATITGTSNAITIDYSSTATSGNLTVSAVAGACTSVVRTQAIVVNPLPSQPSAITGKSSVCQGESGVAYSVTNVPGITYVWSYTGTGATLTGTGNTRTVSYSATATGGDLTVTAVSGACSSAVRTQTIVVNPGPTQPSVISGKTPVCQGEAGVNYSVTAVPGITYSWTYSGTGAAITGTSNAISVDYATTATSGSLTVTAVAGVCSSTVRTQAIVVNTTPAQPSTITGKTPVCQGESGVAYSVTNVPGVTYAWSYSGTGATLSGTGNSRTVDYSATATSGNLVVTAISGTCSSTVRTQAIVVNPIPTQPSVITGKSPVCQSETGVSYSVASVPGVTYTWSYSGTGAVITGNTNAVTIDYSAAATSGTLSVTPSTGSCTGTARTLAIVINTSPAQPSAVTGKTPVCQGETGLSYSVTNVPGVTYAWNYSGTGATLTGTGNTRTIDYSATATSGNVTVTAVLGTCSSAVRTQAIVVNPIPSQPSAITGKTPVCQGETGVSYSVTNDPSVTYTWAYSGTGATLTGTGNTRTIDYSATATSGNLTVTAISAACTSQVRSQAIVVSPIPAQPSAITGKTPVCQGETGVGYSVTNDPSVTYTWSYSGTGATLTGTGNTRTIDFSATATSGNLTVTAILGSCSSAVRTQAIVVSPIPAQPSTITGKTPVCQGESGLTYSVTNVPGVTYTWAYSGTGATITGTGNNRTISYAATATSGNLTVTAIAGTCTSTVRTQAIVVNPIPAQPSAITGKTPVCQGESGIAYSVTAVPSMTYNWAYTGTGATITGTTNAVTVDYSATATSGNLTVSAVANGCSSALSTQAIVVNPIPTQPSAITGKTPVCQGETGLSYSVTNLPGVTYAWNYSGTGATLTGTGNTRTIDYSATATSGNLTVTAISAACTSTVRTQAIVINPVPAQPSAITGKSPVCQSEANVAYSVTNVPGVTYTWSYSGTGATIFGSGNTVSVNYSATATSGTLRVSASTGGCTSTTSSTTNITVNPSPAAPTLKSANSPICVGNTLHIQLNAVGGTTFNWSLPSGSGFTGVNYSQPNVQPSDAGNYLITATANGCTSSTLTVPVTVNPGFIPFANSNSPVCVGGTLTFNATGISAPGATYSWTGPNGFTNANQSFTIPNAQLSDTGTYTVIANVGNCKSSPVSTKAMVNPIPSAPGSITGTASVCQGSAGQSFTVSPVVAGVTYAWSYTGTGATFPSGTTVNPVLVNFTSTATSGNLQVTAISNACSSAVTSTPITIKPLPTTPGTRTTTIVCEGTTLNLSALTITNATYAWTGPNSFVSAIRTPSIPTVASTNAGQYIVTYTLDGCQGDRDTTFVTVNPKPNAGFSYPKTSFCQTDPTTSPVSVPAGSSFSSAIGLALNSATGTIDPFASSPGTYKVMNTLKNVIGCEDTVSVTVTILKNPVARKFTYPSPICDKVVGTISPTYTTLGDVGTFSSASGLSLNATTGQLTPSTSTAGSYRVTYTTINAGCSDTSSTLVSIETTPVKPVLAGATTICQGSTATITATSGAVTNFNWFNGSTQVQTGGNTLSVSASGSYTAIAVGGGCISPVSDSLKLLVNPRPAVPVILGACAASTPPATLSTQYSSTVGYTYEWFRNNVSTATSATLVATTAGLYKTLVKETLTGCTSDTSAAVNPFGSGVSIAVTSGNSVFCIGDSLEASSNSPTGNTWTLGGTPVSTGPTVKVKTGGELILVVTNGSCSGSDTLAVTANPTPAKPLISAAADSLCPRDTLVLATSSTANVQWIFNNTDVLGATGTSFKATQPGFYQVKATLGNCSSVSDGKNITFKVVPAPPLLNITGVQQLCLGSVLPLSIANFVSGQDQWYLSEIPVSAPSGTSQNLSATDPGIYKVKRTSVGGCVSVSDSVDVIVTPTSVPKITLTQSVSQAVCPKSPVVYSASITNAGSTPVIDWYVNGILVQANGVDTLRIDTLTKNSDVRVLVTSSRKCSTPPAVADTVTTLIAPRFKVKTEIQKVGCTAAAPGAVNFTVTGATGIVTIDGLPGFTNPVIIRNPANADTTFNVRFEDSDTKCALDTSITVGRITPFTLTATLTHPTCFDSNGIIKITPMPDTMKYQILTTGTLDSLINTKLKEGIHTISILETKSQCVVDTSFVLNSIGKFTTSIDIQQPDCSGAPNGVVTVNTNVGDPIDYQYIGLSNSRVNRNVGPGKYTMITINPQGCQRVDTVVVGGKVLFAVLADIVQPTCINPLGSIRIHTSPKIDFAVSDELSDSIIVGLQPKTYKVRITDKQSVCFKDTAFTIRKPAADFMLQADTLHPVCSNKNGAINITLIPDTVKYDITGLKEGLNNKLDQGIYNIKVVRRSTGCAIDTNFTLVAKGRFATTVTTVQPDCANPINGEYKVEPTPSGNYSYFLNDVTPTANSATNVAPDRYIIKTTNGICSVKDTIDITGKPSFKVNIAVVQPACGSGGTGSVRITTTPKIDFKVEDDITDSIVNNLVEGTYSFRVIDKASNCFSLESFTIKPTANFGFVASVKPSQCRTNTGEIRFSVNPLPNKNYTFFLDNAIVDSVVTNLAAKAYTVKVIDNATNCESKDSSLTVFGVPDFKITNVEKQLPACSQNNGVIKLTLSEDSSLFTFDNTTGGQFTAPTLRNLGAGLYRAVIMRTGSTCMLDTTIGLSNITDYTVSVDSLNHPDCEQENGKIILKFSQPLSNFTFATTSDFKDNALRNKGAGTYRLSVTSNISGCVKNDAYELFGVPDFDLASSILVSPSCKKADGEILIRMSDKAGVLLDSGLFVLSGDLPKFKNIGLAQGEYNVTLAKIGSSCARRGTFDLETSNAPVATFSEDTIKICDNKPRTLKATTIVPGSYTFQWLAGNTPIDTTTSDSLPKINPDSTTTYKVIVNSDNGCPGMDSIVIVKPSIVKLVTTSHTFNDDRLIRLDFNVVNPKDLPKNLVYIMRRPANSIDWVKIDSVSSKDSVYYNGLAASNQGVYYYKVGLPGMNTCGTSLESRTQRNIQIHAKGDEELETSYLDWNSFVRWDSAVVEYQVWRSLDGGPMNFYVSGNLDTVAQYINASDGREHCYRIKAIEKGPNGNESWSNTVCINFQNILKAYNIFTPNGDGHNDMLMFRNIHFYPNNELHVFNRWGNKVYSKTNYANDWDGDGLPAGTYFYILDLKDGSKPLQGDVLLHR